MSARIVFNKPQSKAGRFVKPGHTVALAFGRGVGKSWFIRRLCYLLISQWEYVERKTKDGAIRGIRVVFLLPTFKQFKDIHARALLNELQGAFAFLGAQIDRTTYTVLFPGGSSIQVFPASEHSGQRARGIRADVAVLDECDDIDINIYDAVVRPWFTEPWSLKIRLASGTPKRGRHGLLYQLFTSGKRGAKIRAGEIEGLDADEIEALSTFYSVHATCLDAPGNVDQREVTAARLSMPPATFAREYMCDFDAGEGLVYPFSEEFHVREPPPIEAFREAFLVGGDHGWVDPGVLLLIGIQGHGNDATLWVLDEYYESEVPNHVWDERARGWNFAKFWVDPSRPDRINDYKKVGCVCGDTDNDLHGGIARVADLLFIRKSEVPGGDWARLHVSPKCINVIREFGLYRRKKNPDGTFSEEPEDKNNHAMDALRYAAVGRFGKLAKGKHEIAPKSRYAGKAT